MSIHDDLKNLMVALGEDLTEVAKEGIDAGLSADPRWVALYERGMVDAGTALMPVIEYGYHHGESPNSEAKEAWDTKAGPLVARALDAGEMATQAAREREERG